MERTEQLEVIKEALDEDHEPNSIRRDKPDNRRGGRVMDNMINITVYADCTGFFTEEEIETENLTEIRVSVDTLKKWVETAPNFNSVEDFLENYTADSSENLVYWLIDNSYGIEIPGKIQYRYGMLHRPFSIGCQPMDGFVYRQGSNDKRYWDILYYNRRLTDEELRSYELEELEAI